MLVYTTAASPGYRSYRTGDAGFVCQIVRRRYRLHGKVSGCWPNGFAQNLTEGILRASYRDSQVKPELLNPGQIYQLAISLWSTSNVFLKGHRLRLEVSSSNFPRFDRNLNTGSSGESETRWTTATNTILHDTEHPSALVLPMIE